VINVEPIDSAVGVILDADQSVKWGVVFNDEVVMEVDLSMRSSHCDVLRSDFVYDAHL
jgi:hypothetical protein